MESYIFCPLCGDKLIGTYVIGKSYRHCPSGHYTYYPNQVVGAVGVVHHDGKILLERRGIEPGYGLWGLPGGMAEQGESIERCIIREVYEETGLQIEVISLLDVLGGMQACIVGYEARVVGGSIRKSEESIELAWFSLEHIPFAEFAFPRHTAILRKWIEHHPAYRGAL
ncbi:NUDIX hydrolase [Paenibacillus marinisediminis]